MTPVNERIREDEREDHYGDREASPQARLAAPNDETQRERRDDDGDEPLRDDGGQREREQTDPRYAEDAPEHERGTQSSGHREKSAQALALAGLFLTVAPRHERIEAREERRAERCREDDAGRHRLGRDRV